MTGALETVGLTPDDITHVLLTPLELYTTGTLHKFRSAQICIAKRGWVHFHTTHDHPHDDRWRSIPKDTLVDLVTDSWDRVRLLREGPGDGPAYRPDPRREGLRPVSRRGDRAMISLLLHPVYRTNRCLSREEPQP